MRTSAPLHELFVNPNHLTAAENASDSLVVGVDAAKIQVVIHDETEQLGVCDALASRGAVLISEENTEISDLGVFDLTT